jgi:hypothetical protein
MDVLNHVVREPISAQARASRRWRTPSRLVGRSPNRSGQQGRDTLLQHPIGWQPNSVADAFGLQEFVEFGLGEGGIGAEVEIDASLSIPRDHRLQQRLPAFSTVSIAGTQKAALEVAELVEQEQRVVAGA